MSTGKAPSLAGSALSSSLEIGGSNERSAYITIVSELLLCISYDGIKLQSGGGHYNGCRNAQSFRTQSRPG